MRKINENNERLAKQVNYQYSSDTAKEEFSGFSDDLKAKADNPYHKETPESEAEKEKKLKEMDDIVKEDIKNTKR